MKKELSTQKNISEYLNKIDKKLSELKKDKNARLKTNGEFRFNPHSTNNIYYINKIRSLEQLLNVAGFLYEKNKAYNDAAKELNVNKYPVFEWLSYTYEEWMHDIKIRILVIKHDKTYTKLQKAKIQLREFMTKEDKISEILKDITIDD